MFRLARPQNSMFWPNASKLDTFRSERPKYLCFDQFWPREIRFERRDQNVFVSTNFDPVWPREIRLDRRDQNIWVSSKFDQARYVSIGTTTNFYVSTKFDQARYVSIGTTKTSRFRQVRLSEVCFDRHDHEFLCSDQVRESKISFDQRDQNIYVSTKFDQASYVSTGATKLLCFDQVRPSLTKRDMFRSARPQTSMFRLSSTKRDMFPSARPQTSMFRLSSTKRDMFRSARSKHLGLDQVRLSEVCFDRHDH